MTEHEIEREEAGLEDLLVRAGRRHRPLPGWQRKVWDTIESPPAAPRMSWAWPTGWTLAALCVAAIFVGGLGGAGAFYVAKRATQDIDDAAAQTIEDMGRAVSREIVPDPHHRIRPTPPPAEGARPAADRDAAATRRQSPSSSGETKATSTDTCDGDEPRCASW